MLTVYLLGVVILGAFCAYRLGQADERTRDEIVGVLFFVAVFWPFVLVMALAIGPFYGFYYLGERNKRKRIQEEIEREIK
jgi:hypothetical protein